MFTQLFKQIYVFDLLFVYSMATFFFNCTRIRLSHYAIKDLQQDTNTIYIEQEIASNIMIIGDYYG